MEKTVTTYRVDDLLVLYTLIKTVGIGKAVNKYIQVHGNWEGALPGDILELWLCYILSACDHRLSGAEEWATDNIDLLRFLSGNMKLSSQDFSDDKLGKLLDYFSRSSSWSQIERDVNSKVLGVYRLDHPQEFATFRLDAAPMQGYGKVVPAGLLQYGYHKHHANLPQFKLKLCTLDNEVNNFAYPICHLTVSGNRSDDELYIPIIKQSKQVLSSVSELQMGNLYVGDKKFSSLKNRLFVHKQLDYYLMPLSHVQLTVDQRKTFIDEATITEQVIKKTKDKEVIIAKGFEVKETISIEKEEAIYEWGERRLFVCSASYAKAQQAALERRLKQADSSIAQLTKRSQGKKVLQTKEEYQLVIDAIKQEQQVEELLEVQIIEHQTPITKRAYGKYPKRIEIQSHFELVITRQEEEIAERKKYMGWQIYATNAPKSLLPFEKCVWKYRYQSNIESRFDDLRNKMAALLPVYLQKENRIEGLVNILLLALKICSMMEYKVAQQLQQSNELLYSLFEGNPKRGTDRPSAKRILKAFDKISISAVFRDGNFDFAYLSPLEPVQQKILQLLGLDTAIYDDLVERIQLFFIDSIIIET